MIVGWGRILSIFSWAGENGYANNRSSMYDPVDIEALLIIKFRDIDALLIV